MKVWYMRLIPPHGATTWSRKRTEGLAAMLGLAFSVIVSHLPLFFSHSSHFHPSILSLFNWLSVKVLLTASTCPCHSKQRQLGDAALSLCCLLPLLCLLLTFHSISSPFSLIYPSILWHFFPFIIHSFFLIPFFSVTPSPPLSCKFPLSQTRITTVFCCVSLYFIFCSLSTVVCRVLQKLVRSYLFYMVISYETYWKIWFQWATRMQLHIFHLSALSWCEV